MNNTLWIFQLSRLRLHICRVTKNGYNELVRPLLALVASWNIWYKTQSVMLWLANVPGLWPQVSIWFWGLECRIHHHIQPLVVHQNTNPPLKNTNGFASVLPVLIVATIYGFFFVFFLFFFCLFVCLFFFFFFFFFWGGGGGGRQSLFSQHDACRSSRLVTRQAFIWGFVCQNQVSRAGTSNYIPWHLLAVITCPLSWYLHLPHK